MVPAINNLRHYWSYFGIAEDFPVELGGNCLYLVNLLQESLFADVVMLQVVNGTHVAALIAGDRFFDPCLLMRKSLLVDSDFAMTNLDLDLSGRIELSRRKYNCLNVTWRVELPNLETTNSYFDFDILNPFPRIANDFHFELNRKAPEMFFLRFLNLSTGFLNTVCFLHATKEWVWTFHPFPSSGYFCQVDSVFREQFYESLDISFDYYQQACLETLVLMNKFNSFRCF